ncbi:uncharacterized protein LOC105200882 [Solenopsis invicta]|uniref:uncharacterized protein LOC105200882 n=1 Tax=Solenopsis invicta TaxID=13686 RepID=UPI000595CF6D|nr:uncharacterized protein LOC105200882 [Solenopsis invicta]
METVKHLWNVNQFVTKELGITPLVMDLQLFYMQKCKNLSKIIALPQQNFGPLVTCSHCGSLWNTVGHQVRILSGKRVSKSVKKIVRCMNENPDQKIPKVRATLVQKSIKNEMNRLVIKCSVCSKNTELPFKKERHIKPLKLNDSQTETPQSSKQSKKKKKKSKDKTAGLNISGCTPVSHLNKKDNSRTSAISPVLTPKIIRSNKPLSTSSKKPKKLNIERLKRIMENQTTPAKRKNLHSFLSELY